MGYFLIKRLIQGSIVIFGVTLAIFLIIRVIPGDPVRIMMSGAAPDEAYHAMREFLGLDRPLLVQFGEYFINILKGDFGHSLLRSSEGFTGTTAGQEGIVAGSREGMARVIDLILARAPLTFALMGVTIVLALVISLPLGIIAGMRPGSIIDWLIVQVSVFIQSIPCFWLGIMLILLVTTNWGLLPSVGYRGPVYLLLPGFTLAVSLIPILVRTIRDSFQAAMKDEFIKALAARGLPASYIMFKHVLRNALIPVITLLGMQIGYLLGWIVVIEFIFSFPGLGLLTIHAVLQRDFPVIQGLVIFFAFVFVVINIIVDAMYAYIDPRIQML